jgi:hypothetical protein
LPKSPFSSLEESFTSFFAQTRMIPPEECEARATNLQIGDVARAVGIHSSQAPYRRVKLGFATPPVSIDSFGGTRLLLTFVV